MAREPFRKPSFDGIQQAPGQATMHYCHAEALRSQTMLEGILVKQTMRGCLRNCMGCQAQQEYHVSGLDWTFIRNTTALSEGAMGLPNEMYILEESNCLCRTCWRDGRPLEFRVSRGGEPGGDPLLKYTKPCGFPLYFSIPIPSQDGGGGDGGDGGGGGGEITCPCCCLLPTLSLDGPDGRPINRSEYYCDHMCCVPKFEYKEPDRLTREMKAIYYVAPDTCLLGCCIRPKGCCTRGCYNVPFYFRDPDTHEKIKPNANGREPQVAKMWSGLKKECCSTADNFATFWPDGISDARKAGLLGTYDVAY